MVYWLLLSQSEDYIYESKCERPLLSSVNRRYSYTTVGVIWICNIHKDSSNPDVLGTVNFKLKTILRQSLF